MQPAVQPAVYAPKAPPPGDFNPRGAPIQVQSGASATDGAAPTPQTQTGGQTAAPTTREPVQRPQVDVEAMVSGIVYGGTVKENGATTITTRLDLGALLADIDFAEVHDCFTIAEIMAYEDLGFCARGEGGRFVEERRSYIGGDVAVNVDGGLKAKGHPIGATGARISTTLLHALKARNLKRGVASLCIGGGEAVAIGVEMI